MDSHLEQDIFAAAFLIVNGCNLENLESIGRFRYGFRFSSAHHATGLVQQFYNRAECSARDYAAALRDLNDQLYQQKRIENEEEIMAAPLQQSCQEVMRELRDRNAVAVVVAVNDQIIWTDLFASTALLEKYWPKLIRSYAAEALTRPTTPWHPDVRATQAFLQDLEARRETVESEPGVYRRTESAGEGFTAFGLTTLLPGTGFDIHIAKMAE
jgi:hypothetical protein